MGNTRLNFLNLAGALNFIVEPASSDGGSGPKPDDNDGHRSTEDQPAPSDDDALGEGGMKALRAERKRAADEKKRADGLESRLQEIADSEKSELQRAQDRIAELEKSTEAHEAEKTRNDLRTSVLASKNVPSEWADFVTGDTEDEMTKAADRILVNLSRADEGPGLQATYGKTGGSLEAGREAAKSFRP